MACVVRVLPRHLPGPRRDDRSQGVTGQYVVRRSDTLFSIAFRYGWDWKALAERNQKAQDVAERNAGKTR